MTNYLSLVDSGRFEELFEELGWGFVPRGVQPVTVDFEGGKRLTANPVADQSGLRVWVVESDILPAPTEQRLVDAAVNKVSQVRLIIFTDGKNQSWRWPRRGATAATNTKLLHHHYEVGNEELGMDLARRLQMIELPIGEKIGILEIQERMAKAFNDEAVKRSHEASGHMRVMNEQLLAAGCTTDASSSLLVRLLFLFFGDDTNMWDSDTFQKWVLHHTTADNIHDKLTELFAVLCDPELDKAQGGKGKYAESEYKNFRRIDGMYKERIELPPLTEDFRQQVLKACGFDWGKVNPDIFGAMFQQLVDLDELRKKGEHYTSEENIMKVIEPLFLDEYRAKFEEVYNDRKKLLDLQDELATLKFLDPACGCGNFLIQAYKHLRGLEYEIILRAEELEVAEINAELDEKEGQRDSERKRALRQRLQEIESGGFINFGEGVLRKSKLSMRQFHGIEINEWPAKVASTAMLLVDHLCNQVWGHSVVRLPIHETPEIRCANALRINWNDVIPADECNFIIGNPPFLGSSKLDDDQKKDRALVFGKNGGLLDFVACWYRKAADYLDGTAGAAAFVSTNSICQGQQVAPLWKPIFDDGYYINFAHRSFVWDSEAETKAKVHCVIVGFSQEEASVKIVWDYSKGTAEAQSVANINGYLADAPNVFVGRRSKPITDVIAMLSGGKPTEGNHLLLTPEERARFIQSAPELIDFVKPFSMGAEFINGKDRYCLWLVDFPKEDIPKYPALEERVEAVRTMRLGSKKVATQKKAATPWLFDELRYRGEGTYIGVPKVSSERRRYIPMGFVNNGMIPGDKLYFVPTDSLYIFGVLMSQVHNAWMRTVAGRLKKDYSYANTIVYNNFVWPKSDPTTRLSIENAAQAVLDARAKYEGTALVDLYDPDKEDTYPELHEAHAILDFVVERAYGLELSDKTWDEKEALIVAHLFKLFEEHTE